MRAAIASAVVLLAAGGGAVPDTTPKCPRPTTKPAPSGLSDAKNHPQGINGGWVRDSKTDIASEFEEKTEPPSGGKWKKDTKTKKWIGGKYELWHRYSPATQPGEPPMYVAALLAAGYKPPTVADLQVFGNHGDGKSPSTRDHSFVKMSIFKADTLAAQKKKSKAARVPADAKKVEMLKGITETDKNTAEKLLDFCDSHLDAAVNMHFAMETDPEKKRYKAWKAMTIGEQKGIGPYLYVDAVRRGPEEHKGDVKVGYRFLELAGRVAIDEGLAYVVLDDLSGGYPGYRRLGAKPYPGQPKFQGGPERGSNGMKLFFCAHELVNKAQELKLKDV